MTDQSYETAMSVVPLEPKPAECQTPTIASYTLRFFDQVWGPDVECVIERSCGHTYFRAWRIPWVTPVVGERAMGCLGPEPETAPSGRADKSVAPLKKGRRWTRLPVKVA